MPDKNITGDSTPLIWAQWGYEQPTENTTTNEDNWKKTNIWDVAAAMQAGAYMG